MFRNFSSLKIGFLASGNLGFNVISPILSQVQTIFIATDSNSIEIVEMAKNANIPLYVGNPRGGKLNEFILGKAVDLILSINYLFLIEKDIISKAEFAINFHGSLLPKYRGRTPHVWAIINNEKITGVTAHLINEGCDTGDVLLQKQISIEDTMTGADVLKKYNELYPQIVKDVLELYLSGSLNPIPQDDSIATYFGKRTFDDGPINWEWQRERIFNWVRAQSYPYPGAFTWFEGNKIIIDKVGFSDLGFNYAQQNGLILANDGNTVIVKCSNGALSLVAVRDCKWEIFKQGKYLTSKRYFLSYREAAESDCKDIFLWNNETVARINSFSTKHFSFEDHKKWFDKNIKDKSLKLLIFYNSNDQKIGLVRLRENSENWLISINVRSEFRGAGYASEMIELASNDKFRQNKLPIIAKIKSTNLSSIRAFKKAGYQFLNTIYINQVKCYQYVYQHSRF